ncbi:MAG TPA: permease [Gemmatimonadetes bacterium]|nr:permease [Gemmatimonadota bacterium]
MSVRFALGLARRELRSSARRIGVYMLSISLGVMALVAIHGFSSDLNRSVQDEAERLLGANARLSSNRPLPEPVAAVVDSLAAAGHPSARVTSVVSMVQALRTATVRLLQVRGVDPGYPFFGTVHTVPAGAWPPRAGEALVDPAVLTMLDARLGDSLVVGEMTFRVSATVEDLMGDFGLQTAVGPRVWIGRDGLDDAGLLAFGSLARYERYLSLPNPAEREAVQNRHSTLFDSAQVRWTTAEAQAKRLTRSLNYLSRYLGLVGLAALLLGGVGVGSAVYVFVKERRTAVAVLRCVGAGQASIFAAYLIQAGALGLGGATLGAFAGLGVQRLLPMALGVVLPVQVTHQFAWQPVVVGLGVGLWVALLFTWIPLLALRDVPPLAALREGVESYRHRVDPLRLLAWAALAGTVALLSVMEAPERDQGLSFAVGLAATVAVLWGIGSVVVRLTRRYLPKRAPYPVRQGIANLFRPQNQTVAITLALGFGVFAVGTILQVESALVSGLALDEHGRANLVLFDIQPDQEAGVIAALPTVVRETAALVPLVPARIAAVKGATVAELSDGGRVRGRLRREYRNTWRDTLTTSETLVAGSWWKASGEAPYGTFNDEIARISLEVELADNLGVGIGDHITWDFAGREVETVVANLRTVDWARFEPNFFVVFEPGALEGAPRTSVVVVQVDDPTERARLQTTLVRTYPNISAVDMTRVQEALERVLARVNGALRFLGLFTAVAGVIVLAGALGTSRFQRMRESALLRTLGARRGQVRIVLLVEYLALGTLASITGIMLSVVVAGTLARTVFELGYVPDLDSLAMLWAGVTALTVVVGLSGSGGLLRHPPLPALRQGSE